MASNHFVQFYACGKHVESQCRCPDANKSKRTGTTPCPECKEATSETLKRLEGIEARVEKTTPGEWTCWGGGGYVSIGLDRPCEIAEKKPGANHGAGIDRGAGRDYIFMARAHADVPWLCASLRDALLLCDVLEKRLWNRATDAEVDASALARRRLFGEEQDRG